MADVENNKSDSKGAIVLADEEENEENAHEESQEIKQNSAGTFYAGHGSRPNVQAEQLQTSMSGNPEEGNFRLDFDNLGPVILNKDGTVSRMKNWNELTIPEQERALRVIQKRNAKRRAKLLAEKEQEN